MRRRTKKPVVWLPQDLNNRLGIAPVVATDVGQNAHFIIAATGPALGNSPDAIVIPLVKDERGAGQEVVDTTASLADIENSSYRLRRIVGKIVVAVAQGVSTTDTDPTAYQITLGIIVLKVRQDGTPKDTALSQYRPERLDATMDPWIWRRSWCLSDRAPGGQGNNNIRFPISNVENYSGGNSDGSHVDQKTARVVGPEERLFLCGSVQGLDGSPAAQNPGLIIIIGDLRYLGTMRSSMGNRRNASR